MYGASAPSALRRKRQVSRKSGMIRASFVEIPQGYGNRAAGLRLRMGVLSLRSEMRNGDEGRSSGYNRRLPGEEKFEICPISPMRKALHCIFYGGN